MLRLIIADDHPLVRKGLIQIITDEPDLEVCHEASDSAELLKLLRLHEVDMVILDISMPGLTGFDILPKIKVLYPTLPIIMLSALSEDIYTMQCMKSGAAGFLSKESAPEELVKAIRKVAAGGIYLSPSFTEKLALGFSEKTSAEPHERLSNREFQIMLLLGSGKSVSEIGLILTLSNKTVSTYRLRILDKMRMKSNVELIKYCVDHKLIP